MIDIYIYCNYSDTTVAREHTNNSRCWIQLRNFYLKNISITSILNKMRNTYLSDKFMIVLGFMPDYSGAQALLPHLVIFPLFSSCSCWDGGRRLRIVSWCIWRINDEIINLCNYLQYILSNQLAHIYQYNNVIYYKYVQLLLSNHVDNMIFALLWLECKNR